MRNFSVEPLTAAYGGGRRIGMAALAAVSMTVWGSAFAQTPVEPLEISGFQLDQSACSVISEVVTRGFADLTDNQWEQVIRAGCVVDARVRRQNSASSNLDNPSLEIEMGYCTIDLVHKAEQDWAADKLARWDLSRVTGNLVEEDLKCITAINLRGGFLPYSWASHIKISFRDFPNRTSAQCDPNAFEESPQQGEGTDYAEATASAEEDDVEVKDTGYYSSDPEGQSGDGASTPVVNGTPNCPKGPVDGKNNSQPYNSVVHRIDWWIHWQNQDQWRLLARSRVIRDFFERYQPALYPKPSAGRSQYKLRACHAVAGRAKTQLVYQGPAPRTEAFESEHAYHLKHGVKCNCEAHYKDQYLVFTVSREPDASVTLWKGPNYERAWLSQRNRYISERLDREIMDSHLSNALGPNYGRFDAKPDNAKVINRSKAQAPSSVRPYIGGEACREVLKYNKFQKNYTLETQPKKGPLLPNL